MNGLLLPLQAEDNRPIRDAAGQLVSIPQFAGAFAAAMNHHGQLVAMLKLLHGNTTSHHLDQAITALLDHVEKSPKLPVPTEATEDQVFQIIDCSYISEVQAHDFAKAILVKFKVYPR